MNFFSTLPPSRIFQKIVNFSYQWSYVTPLSGSWWIKSSRNFKGHSLSHLLFKKLCQSPHSCYIYLYIHTLHILLGWLLSRRLSSVSLQRSLTVLSREPSLVFIATIHRIFPLLLCWVTASRLRNKCLNISTFL